MTALRFRGLSIPDCEEAIERNYFNWGREWRPSRPEDSEPNWFRASPEERRTIAHRGYALYDGLPPRPGNRIEPLDVYLSVGIGSNVVFNDAVRFLVRADKASELLARIPEEGRLEGATDDQIAATAELIELFSDAYQVKWGKATKVFHKEKPAFIPVLDSVVVDFFWKNFPQLAGGYSQQNAETLLRLFKDELTTHADVLGQIQAALELRGFHLSTVRLLDYLVWLGSQSVQE